MKKTKKKIALLIALITCFAIAGCSVMNSKIVSADEFKSVMEKRQMKVSDMAAADINNSSVQSHLKTAYKATAGDYEFIFAEFDDKSAGENYFKTYVDDLKSKHTFNGISTVTVNDNNEWTGEADGYYNQAIRKSGTVVIVTAKSEAKNTAKDIIKELGY